jgi:hypothetical protein
LAHPTLCSSNLRAKLFRRRDGLDYATRPLLLTKWAL